MRLDGSTLSVYTAPFIDTATVVPVELKDFTSVVNGDKIELTWQTATELNNYGFDIERKMDNTNSDWIKIGTVRGNGNSTSALTYSYIDAPSKNGSYFYIKSESKKLDLPLFFQFHTKKQH